MSKKLTNSIIIQRLVKLYNDQYDLSMVNYTGMKNKITLICLKHGPWARMAEKELIGAGCPKCNYENMPKNRTYNKLKTTDEFINQAKQVHGDTYDYSLVKYKNADTKIKIICPSHGEFEQLPWGHLKYGCRQCNIHKSKIEKEWLNSFNNKNIIHQYRLDDLKIIVDGFDPSTNTVYEFYGDYWHGNPSKFNPLLINTRTPKQKTFGELYQDTVNREHKIISSGYKLISIWEADYLFFSKNLPREKQSTAGHRVC